jgi:hypothetical protein
MSYVPIKNNFAQYPPGGIPTREDPMFDIQGSEVRSPGKRDKFLNDDESTDPILIIMYVLFIVICVLLGLCMIASIWCKPTTTRLDISKLFPSNQEFKAKLENKLGNMKQSVTSTMNKVAEKMPTVGRGESVSVPAYGAYESGLSF